MKRSLGLVALMALAACNNQPPGEPVMRAELNEDGGVTEIVEAPSGEATPAPAPSVASACTSVTFEDVPLTHSIADPAEHRITTALVPSDGENFGRIAAFASSADADGIAFAMNGGMYGDDLRAIGYYVQNSERLSELNRAEGPGNFHMKPNGVFFGSNGTWRVLDTETFFRTVGDRPQFGTQSGPMLVIEGDLRPRHPASGEGHLRRADQLWPVRTVLPR